MGFFMHQTKMLSDKISIQVVFSFFLHGEHCEGKCSFFIWIGNILKTEPSEPCGMNCDNSFIFHYCQIPWNNSVKVNPSYIRVKWGSLEKHMFWKALSLVSPAGPTMIGAKGQGKFLNSKGSRSLENATFF